MQEMTTSHLIELLKSRIEEKQQWGNSRNWTKYDFERLSEDIFKETRTNLSVSTLMRVFGKVSYGSSPSVTTLNVLANFLGYTDWRTFSKNYTETKETTDKAPRKARLNRRKVLVTAGITLFIITSTLILQQVLRQNNSPYSSKDFKFSSRQVLDTGVPNSVVFEYDAGKARENDSVFISQTWDTRRKFSVSKHDRQHSSIYYHPGYFRAKLMVSNQIIKEHDVLIKTKGWLGLIENKSGREPYYYPQEKIWIQKGAEIRKESAGNLNLPYAVKTGLFNIREFKGMRSDNFRFEAELKTQPVNEYPCTQTDIIILTKEGVLILPLVRKGCTGDISLHAFGYEANSQNRDLSEFSCDPVQWNNVKIEARNNTLLFLLNGREIHRAEFHIKAAEIVGIHIRYQGYGAIRNSLFSNGKETIFF